MIHSCFHCLLCPPLVLVLPLGGSNTTGLWQWARSSTLQNAWRTQMDSFFWVNPPRLESSSAGPILTSAWGPYTVYEMLISTAGPRVIGRPWTPVKHVEPSPPEPTTYYETFTFALPSRQKGASENHKLCLFSYTSNIEVSGQTTLPKLQYKILYTVSK